MNVTQTFIPEAILVQRGNDIEDSYYDAIYAEKRKEALRMAGRQAIEHVRQLPRMIVNAGYVVLEHMLSDPYAEAGGDGQEES